jgi:predicted DCC family thiol-disulfide oxidoreductase YuxK
MTTREAAIHEKNMSHKQQMGWVLYDGDCPLCVRIARALAEPLRRRGFETAPLQAPWVTSSLGLRPEELLDELRVVTPEGQVIGGGDAVIYLSRLVPMGWPLYLLARLPGVRPVVDRGYRFLADRRHCLDGVCRL